MHRNLGAAAMAAMVLCATSAAAQDKPTTPLKIAPPGGNWTKCDGYGGVSLTGDGMTSYATTWFVFISFNGGDRFRRQAGSGAEGVAACDEVLQDPLIVGRYAMRRASLLRAKSIHQIVAGDAKGALATLDLVEAVPIEPKETHYQRSFGVGSDFVRAYALSEIGDRDKARAVARKATAERPYSSDMSLAASILAGRTGDRADARNAQRARARLNPRNIEQLSAQAFKDQQWEEVVALYPNLVPRKPYDKSGFEAQQMANIIGNRAAAEVFWARSASIKAIALAHLGRHEEARAVMAAAKARLDSAGMEVIPLVIDNKPVKSKTLPDFAADMNQEMVKVGQTWIDAGNKSIDLVKRDVAAAPTLEDDKSDAKPLGEEEDELGALLRTLPEIEVARQTPTKVSQKDGKYFARNYQTTTGYSDRVDPVTGINTIFYRLQFSTTAVNEELALLHAAQYVLAQGKDSFVILDRINTNYTMTVRTNGIPSPPDRNGSSIELKILPVDSKSPPDMIKAAEWRLLDAQAVVGAIGPLYPAMTQTGGKAGGKS
jgi:tetratricopeptide (TPR) repeat protein